MKRAPISSWLRGSLALVTTALAIVHGGGGGCAPSPDVGGGETKDDPATPSDIADALARLPEAHVLTSTFDGVPTYIVGEMAKVGAAQTDDLDAAQAAIAPALPPILAAFRLETTDLQLRKINVDENGGRHYRFDQKRDGLDVIGGELVVHVDVKGAIFAVNGSARGDINEALGSSPIPQSQAVTRILAEPRFASLSGRSTSSPRPVYIETDDGVMHKAYEIEVKGQNGQDPLRDKVYIDQDNGEIVATYPQIHFAENRKVYSANNGSTTPGTLKRSEGQAPTTDVDVNAAYDNTGSSYQAYKMFWNRDSYNNAGAALISTVHYQSGYCNAYWDGTQMVYGDGSPSQNCAPLARSLDVTAHELTHAVTSSESNLVYSGESGGMNEALSDIFGAFVEAWVDGGKTGTLTTSTDTWLVGEDILPPALRFMCDPAADGASKDVWTSSVGSVDVHYSSGIGNLAFCLLTKGGTHPRGKTTVNVPGIGMEKAIRIMYKAQTDILTSTSKFAAVRTAMEQASIELGYDTATKDAVGCAWAAVAVGTAPGTCGGSTPPPPPTPTDGTLTNGTAVTGLADAVGGQKFWKLDVPANQSTLTIAITGGTGDADMYIQSGSKPSTSAYLCRPYKNGNVETCTFTPPTAGTYWVMLNAYTAYTGVSLTGSYSASTTPPTSGDPYLTNGTAVTSVAGAAASATFWRITVPAGRTLTVKTSGGTGDADLYTRAGQRPTTSTYACRPYLNGNNETCTATTTTAGDHYVMVRGYTAYTGLSLIASY